MRVYPTNDRRANYDPATWTVQRLSPTQYEATNRKTGRWMLYTVAWGRIFSVASDSGTQYELVVGCCSCPDNANGALREGRHCAHAAGALAVEAYLEFERRSEAAAAQFQAANPERCRRALAEVEPLAGPATQANRAEWARVVATELELNPGKWAA